MNFYKYHSNGNDFILIDTPNLTDDQLYHLAKNLCVRYYSIGADGLLYIDKKDKYYFMKIFNSDGSQATMCGNGIRIFFYHLFKNGKINKKDYIYTLAGLQTLKIDDNDEITLYINEIEHKYYDIYKEYIIIDNYKLYLIWPGNAHAIIFTQKAIDYSSFINLSNYFKSNNFFENGINLDFVYIRDDNNIDVLIYERGVGPTLSCGTAALASGYAAIKYKKIKPPVNVKMPGGILKVGLENEKLYLKGKVNRVFKGEIDSDDINI